MTTPIPPGPPSDRTRVRRYHWLAKYDRDTINDIIDAGIVSQIGYVFHGSPFVTPTCHWRIDDCVYWHGSAASRMMKTLDQGVPVCFTVTHLDGGVFSRAAFNHNILYRSVMAFGTAELLDEPFDVFAVDEKDMTRGGQRRLALGGAAENAHERQPRGVRPLLRFIGPSMVGDPLGRDDQDALDLACGNQGADS